MEKFINAHNKYYEQAEEEIILGKKESHWMWFIFPQYKGLGHSNMSKYYAIQSLNEAQEYASNNILYNHYYDLLEALITLHNDKSIEEIFGNVDAKKLKSSLTLFLYTPLESICKKALKTFYNNEKDNTTVNLILEEQADILLKNACNY